MTPTNPREPSRDELLAMAFVDGELDSAGLKDFEKRMATEPALAREVAELQKLELLARGWAPPEPKDSEWQRLEDELLQSTGWTLGWILLAVGGIGLGLFAAFEILTGEMAPLLKFFLAVTIGGLTVLFLLVLRGRLRTLPLDPYTEVER
ncbi:MAG: hypothetical protein CMJ89_19890 [Planctomycetes bacterium]|jgi:hypothetical protein|nr:hypothetical protein [Planctomycetota bacterium]